MNREILAALVMLNNYFHDLAVAVLFTSILTGWLIWRGMKSANNTAGSSFFQAHVWPGLSKSVRISFAWIFIGGVIRALAYKEYEWLPAAGRDQIAALVVKHILLGSMVAFGIYLYVKMSRGYTKAEVKGSSVLKSGAGETSD